MCFYYWVDRVSSLLMQPVNQMFLNKFLSIFSRIFFIVFLIEMYFYTLKFEDSHHLTWLIWIFNFLIQLYVYTSCNFYVKVFILIAEYFLTTELAHFLFPTIGCMIGSPFSKSDQEFDMLSLFASTLTSSQAIL